MQKNTVNVLIPVDADIKDRAEALFAEMGLSLSDACNIFVCQCIAEGGIPFLIRLSGPNQETVSSPLEEKRIETNLSISEHNR